MDENGREIKGEEIVTDSLQIKNVPTENLAAEGNSAAVERESAPVPKEEKVFIEQQQQLEEMLTIFSGKEGINDAQRSILCKKINEIVECINNIQGVRGDDEKEEELTNFEQPINNEVNHVSGDEGVVANEAEDAAAELASKDDNNKELITKSIEQEKEEYDKDNKDLEKNTTDFEIWRGRAQKLSVAITELVQEVDRIKSGELQEENKEQINLTAQKVVSDRIESLKIITDKQIGRLEEQKKIKKLVLDSERQSNLIPPKTESEWREFLQRHEVPLGETDKKIREELSRVSNERYKMVIYFREMANKQKQNYLDFIKKQCLDIMDGLLRGKKFTEEENEKNVEEKKHYAESLKKIVECYNAIIARIGKLLEDNKVFKMEANINDSIDYEKHEPIGSEKKRGASEDSIIAIVRDGYEFKDNEEDVTGGVLILRPAQVIVAVAEEY